MGPGGKMGWSMGWDVKDADRSIKDDGRTLHPAREDEYEYAGGISEMPALVPPSDCRQVLVYHDQKFISETVYIRPDQVLVTEWESMYSAFRLNRASDSAATFSPIVDHNLRVVGHVGWADGTDIIVPERTIRNHRLFWSILQKVRLGEERQQLLDEEARKDRARPFPDSPLGRPTTSAPKDASRWSGPDICVPRPHTMSLETRTDQARRGPLKDKSTEETYRIDLHLFVTGGGRAFVGRHFFDRGDALYLPSIPGVPDGRLGSPKTLYSSGFEFLLVVDPEGRIQRVMRVRKSLYSHADALMDSLQLALTLSIVLDIALIPVVLLASGIRIGMRMMIQALKLIINREAEEIIEVAFEELTRAELAEVKGGMAKAVEEITEATVREAMKGAPLKSQQANVSLPTIRKYVRMLQEGKIPPAIKVDQGIIVEGNHRYIAGRIFGKDPPIQAWSGGRPAWVVSWQDIVIDLAEW
jgi:hypothetical protein